MELFMRIYLVGPMSGLPEFNFPLFNEVAAKLRAAGHQVFSPADRDIERHPEIDFSSGDIKKVVDQGFSLRDALADDTQFICLHADTIYMLPGWERSFGSLAEHALAVALKHRIIYHV